MDEAAFCREHGFIGVGFKPGGGAARHAVNRRTGKTLCGLPVVSIFGIDLTSRRQVSCQRCYRLAFVGVNAKVPSTPDTPLELHRRSA